VSGNLLVVGSLNMDLVVNVSRHPRIGETILGGRFATFPGGKGANQAVAAARMGAHVSLIGCLGSDGFGAELRQVAAGEGIDIRHISTVANEATGIALITVDQEGRNTIVVASGANLALSPGHLHAAEDAFSNADLLIAQLESPLETVREAIGLAAEKRIPVVLNPAPAQRLDEQLLSQVDYLIPNEGEALQIAGTESLDAAIERLLAMGVRNLIITLGEQGVLVVSTGAQVRVPAYRVKAIDTVAAGDAFVGAFSTAMAQGLGLEAAARLGNAAAAISVTRPGAQPSLPTRAEVEEFLGARK
jgi:ribokinase